LAWATPSVHEFFGWKDHFSIPVRRLLRRGEFAGYDWKVSSFLAGDPDARTSRHPAVARP